MKLGAISPYNILGSLKILCINILYDSWFFLVTSKFIFYGKQSVRSSYSE